MRTPNLLKILLILCSALLLAAPIFLAQNMDGMGSGRSSGGGAGIARPRLPSGVSPMSDAPSMAPMVPMAGSGSMPPAPGGDMLTPRPGAPPATGGSGRQAFVPLGQVADIKVAGGPPMVRDEAGLLVGYVYVWKKGALQWD